MLYYWEQRNKKKGCIVEICQLKIIYVFSRFKYVTSFFIFVIHTRWNWWYVCPSATPCPREGRFVSREWLVAKDLCDPSCGSLVPLLSETRQLFSVIWNHDRRIYLIIHLLLVWTRRYGGHLGGHEQKNFFLLGTKVYFHVNPSRKSLLFWPLIWPPYHMVANQELLC